MSTWQEFDEWQQDADAVDAERYYVGCGAFGGGHAQIEYYVADSTDGSVVKRGLSEIEADVLCAELNLRQ